MSESATKGEIVTIERAEMITTPATNAQSLMTLIDKLVMRKDLDLDRLQKLFEMQERWDKEEARKAFTVAMTEFHKDAPLVVRDKDNKQYGSQYASLGGLVNSATPTLSRCGLSADWEIDTSGITVTCVVTHVKGHVKRVSMTGPPDKTGEKNTIQQIKSTVTYLRSCTYESALGLASTDANLDDDGNGASGGKERMDSQAVEDYISAIYAGTTEDEIKRTYFEAYRKAEALDDRNSMRAFEQAKNVRKKAIQCK